MGWGGVGSRGQGGGGWVEGSTMVEEEWEGWEREETGREREGRVGVVNLMRRGAPYRSAKVEHLCDIHLHGR